MMKRCDGSDGQAKDSGLIGPWFNLRLMQEKQKRFYHVFGWLLRNLCDPPLSVCCISANTHDNKQSRKQRKRYPLSLRCVQVPLTIKEQIIEEHTSFDSSLHRCIFPLLKDVHAPCLHERTYKNQNLFEILTRNVSLCII